MPYASSSCVLDILSTGVVYKKQEDVLLLVTVSDGTSTFPGVIPESQLTGEVGTKTRYACDCYLKNDVKDDKFFTYLNIIYAEPVPEDTAYSSKLKVEGRIQKNTGIRHVGKNRAVILLLKIKAKGTDRQSSLLHLILKNELALKYANIQDGLLIKGEGHLHLLHLKSLEIVMDTFEKKEVNV